MREGEYDRMEGTVPEVDLVRAARQRFPREAEETDRWLRERGLMDDVLATSTFQWIEAFADRVTDAIKLRRGDIVTELTSFMAEQYRDQPDALQGIMDVAFAENLMWDVGDEAKVWAWPFIAAEIRHLYAEMWSDPTQR